MIGRPGRDRFRREFSPRFEEKGHFGRSNNPPSRHLWVGNLSHHITEAALSEQLLRFGDLESIYFQPGRSYAFVNFKKEEDAIIAIRGLQGFIVAGLPLKIEFAKEKSSSSSRDDDYLQHRDERRSAERVSPFSHRDTRTFKNNSESFYPDKPRMEDKNAEPSEVLWIGFPSFLNVDEMILKRAFSPFGEIEKITIFPGRSYAFVRFRSIMAACKAKEALQGKLFNNPRVNICFAKSDTGPSDHPRNPMNFPFPPHPKPFGHIGRSTENFQPDTNFWGSNGDPYIGSPRFVSSLESGDSSISDFGRNASLRTGGNGTFEQVRMQNIRPEIRPTEDIYGSPARKRGATHHDFSPKTPHHKSPLYEGNWDFPDDSFHFHEAKKLKTGSFTSDKELPEYPFSGEEQDGQHIGLPRTFHDFPDHEVYNKSFESGPFGYKQITDPTVNLSHLRGEKDGHWKAPYNSFLADSGSFPSNPDKWNRFTPESHQSPLNEEWKWEGTIAKGGTPVCRARCFPVGKVLDTMLPEFLNCTARTGLDMLAKHYYQAASSWVVFFVPETDADMGFYNEFMHYLGEKQRAAVAKLGEKTTLFLVPPSDFSENVLKVPGKMSISGVILRFQHPNSDFGVHHPLQSTDTRFSSFDGDTSYSMLKSPDIQLSTQNRIESHVNSHAEPFPSLTSFTDLRRSGTGDLQGPSSGLSSSAAFSGSIHSIGRRHDHFNENRHELPLQHNQALTTNWSPHHLRNSNLSSGNLSSQASNNATLHSGDPVPMEYLALKQKAVQETSSSHYTPGISGVTISGTSKFSQQENRPPVSVPMPIPSLQPEQLAQLASLLGQQQQLGGRAVASPGDHKQPSLTNLSEHKFRSSQSYTSQNQASPPRFSTSQYTSNAPPLSHTGQTEVQGGGLQSQHGNQPLQNTSSQEETEADPQKRLQATLQLAAALLQQIQQQGKGGGQ